MRWGMRLNTLVPFAVGFCKGFLEESRPQPAGAMPARPAPLNPVSRSYDFCAHMQALSEATGNQLASVDDEGVGFYVPANGSNYTVILLLNGPQIIIRACSRIKFPPRHVPRRVAQVLVNMNAKLPRFSYDLIHASDCSYCYATCQVPVQALTPASFEAALDELITAVAALDYCLVTEGYA